MKFPQISAIAPLSLFLPLLVSPLPLRASPNPSVPVITTQAPSTNSLAAQQMQQVAQQQNATLVQYSLLDNSQLYIWVIPPTGKISFQTVDLATLDSSLSDLVRRSRGDVVRARSLNPNKAIQQQKGIISVQERTGENPTNALQQLYQVLIAPIAESLPTDPEARIAFIPQGDLFLVPWAALQDADDNYLIEKHTLFTAPSIQALALMYRRKQEIAGKASEVLIVGNPAPPLIPKNLPPLPPIPGAEREAKAIAELFGVQPLLGDAATETAIIERMPNAGMIHFATCAFLEIEGVTNPNAPGAIILAADASSPTVPGEKVKGDGFLTASEILDLNLQAELAVLSAPDTALGTITGDGVVGLSRSFLSAGVPTVIASLWSIPDAPTTALMIEFHRQLQTTGDTAKALRGAMLQMIEENPDPRDWAGFIIVGTVE